MKTRQLILLTAFLTIIAPAIVAQSSGSIKGRVLDDLTDAPLAYANIWVEVGANYVGATSDAEGFFTLKPLDPGIYDLHVSFVGYGEFILEQISISPDKITFVKDCRLLPGTNIPPVEVVWEEELIDKDGQVDKIIDGKTIGELADNRNIVKVITTITPGLTVSDNERDFSFRGARVGDAVMVVDGIRLRGNEPNLPGNVISSVTVFSGGIPAKYGDTTGGVVVIETMSYFEWEARQRSKYRK